MLHVTTDGDGIEDWKKMLRDLYLRTPGAIQRGKFTLRSGKETDLYIDSRLISLSTRGLQLIGSCMMESIATEFRDHDFNAVGGMTMGADPIVSACALLSGCWGIPLHGFLIRKEAKSYGTGKRIEGPLAKRDRVVLVEDVTTSGSTLIEAAQVVQEFGCKVLAAFTVVDREEGGREALAAHGIPLYSVLDRKDLTEG